MAHWLYKSEPSTWSFDEQKAAGEKGTEWSGVRNYQARNFMRDGMQLGDGVLFYHSNTQVPGIYGLGEVACTSYPDPTQFERRSKYFDEKATLEEPRWYLVDVKYVRHLDNPVPLDLIRTHADALGEEFALIRKGSRLSVLPVTAAQWKILLGLEHKG